MERTRRLSLWLSLVVVLRVVVACPPVPQPPGPHSTQGQPPPRASVGRVHVDSDVVRVNYRPVKGMVPLFIGDDVRTEHTGRATIYFDAGGTLVLGPDTDPQLQLVSEAGCVGAAVL